MASHIDPLFLPLGNSGARLFGMSAEERARRIATNIGMDIADAPQADRPVLAAAMNHAWDPAWLKALRGRPATVLVYRGRPVLAHIPAGEKQSSTLESVKAGAVPSGYEVLDAETAELSYAELRKRERPFVLSIDPADPEPVERALYDAAY